jgi:hypothetical protein
MNQKEAEEARRGGSLVVTREKNPRVGRLTAQSGQSFKFRDSGDGGKELPLKPPSFFSPYRI